MKTRLVPCIGNQATLALYRAFLADTLHAARQSGATVALAHTSGANFPEQDFADITFEQRGQSFGERFDAALEDAANQLPKETPLVLIGADTPHLSPRFLRKTFDELKTCGAVIGPNINGGFYLLGFSMPPVPVAEAFAQPASREVPEVVRLLRKAGVKPKLLEFCFDVDQPEDLTKLKSFLRLLECTESEWIPPCTRAVLADLVEIESIKHHEGERNLESRLELKPRKLFD